jgi:hypothetical protein
MARASRVQGWSANKATPAARQRRHNGYPGPATTAQRRSNPRSPAARAAHQLDARGLDLDRLLRARRRSQRACDPHRGARRDLAGLDAVKPRSGGLQHDLDARQV